MTKTPPNAAGLEALRDAHSAWQGGDSAGTEAHCRRALALGVDDPRVFLLLGIALRERDPVAAESELRRAMDLDATLPDAPFQLGNLNRRQGRYADAIANYSRALSLAPDHAAILNNLALAQEAAGERERANESWRKALRRDPGHRQARDNLIHALARDGAYREAADLFDKHVTDAADVPAGLWVDCGICRHHLKDYDGAEACFRRALELVPEDALVLANLGSALAEAGNFERAQEVLARAAALDPGHLHTATLLANCRQHLCLWDGLAALHAHIRELASRVDASEASKAGEDLANPFTALSIPLSPADQLHIAQRWARSFTPATRIPAHPPSRGARNASDRIRIGYVSSDFRTHAVAFLLTEVLERHDRERFETHAYSIGPRESTPLRARIEAAFEHFHDALDESARETACRIAGDGIDVLIDLNGYTTHARSAIFASRPAPVQVAWLGYLGTTGADFIDYVITDRIATPDALQPWFSERALLLPNCCCPSDTRRAIAAEAPARDALGLPREGFVFCGFNKPYKLLPDVFTTWMRILSAVPGSVLWLAPGSEAAAANLRREAEARGVAASRLVFAPYVEPEVNLARLRRADLFLDTTPYGAGTMANDALWVGLPVLTCMGATMAGRVAASQLHAIGMPEMAATDLREYEEKAIDIARDPAKARAVAAKLARNRATAPLFDMARFTRDLEAAYLRIARP